MKKLLLLSAALLPALLAHSQEADHLGRYAEVTLIPRLDINPTYTAGDSGLGFNHGNSSIYTLFEGSLSEHFSWTVANHWLHNGGDYAWPYLDLGRSDTPNWLDYLLADFSFGNWTVSLGKGMISNGGFEFDEWDWDVHTDFTTPLWDNLACYQWGGTVAWTSPSEMTELSLQMTTSPYGEHPFTSGLWSYSAQWRGDYGWFSNIWSVSALEYGRGDYDWLVTLGQRFTIDDDWTITVDWSNNSGYDEEEWRLLYGTTLRGSVAYEWDDFDLSVVGVYVDSSSMDPWFSAGAIFQFYPLDELVLHAYAGYNSLLETATLSLGARYYLSFNLFRNSR